MRKETNRIIYVMIVLIFVIILVPNKVQAALQANKGGAVKVNTSADSFFTQIREIEDSIAVSPRVADTENPNSYKDASGVNGIDVHMAKNTEWGTAALLAASAYGSVPSARSGNSTTGNKSGIYNMADDTIEYVSTIFVNGSTVRRNNNNKSCRPKIL